MNDTHGKLQQYADLAQNSVGDTALVARQPIFDLSGCVWGYELLFRDPSLQSGLGDKSMEAATSIVMLDGFELMRPLLIKDQRFFINFTADFLAAGLPALLPPELCVIEILESVIPTTDVIKGIHTLRELGYVIALDDYTGQPHLAPFLPIVDIVKVDVLELSPENLAQQASVLMRYPVRLLAEKVESHEVAQRCRLHGFTLFQGYFYGKAEIIRGKKLSPSQITKLRLLNLATNQAVEMEEIIRSISMDVVLSYKLLKQINSVHSDLVVRIHNVGHAVNMFGAKRIRQWLYVTALAEMDSSPMSQELVRFSALRAKFLETLAQKFFARSPQLQSNVTNLYLVGLFSLLESMVHIPLHEIIASLPLDAHVLEVLTKGTGPFALWYQLMEAYEKANWPLVTSLASELHLSSHDLAAAYLSAESWSLECVALLPASPTAPPLAAPKVVHD